MDDLQFALLFVLVSALWGGFWWWLLWRIAGLKPVSESKLGRRVLKGVALVIGVGLPAMAAIGSVLFFYI